jgi:hypothetical protein
MSALKQACFEIRNHKTVRAGSIGSAFYPLIGATRPGSCLNGLLNTPITTQAEDSRDNQVEAHTAGVGVL